MRRFFIPPEKIAGNQAVIDGPEAHHLLTVTRLGPGDRVAVFDGTGNAYDAVISGADGKQVWLELTERKSTDPGPFADITLAQGYLKDKKMDNLVRPLTELGLTRWIPFMARRSVPAPDGRRLQARLTRWRKLSLEAMKQSRRNHPLSIDFPRSYEDVLIQADVYAFKILFWEKASSGIALEPQLASADSRIFILIGPEGGFEDAEVTAAQERGFRLLGLGPRILRSETAAVAACTLVQYLWGDLGSSAR